ncbi:hypothetical protein CTI12_AA168800 [Artemisia annua]|uniref:Uncharacterized protein n=1 Tax=Artemisia annua TaxID=35608 RepID=A0A2U1PC91_ARTAN|nr:hypothetical protein CTI12_AA168800 [Artemisia annua]
MCPLRVGFGAVAFWHIGRSHMVDYVGSLLALQAESIWLARSKSIVGSCGLSEGLGHLDPRVGGNALGWFHRAAITPRFRQWKDNKPKLIRLACQLVRNK